MRRIDITRLLLVFAVLTSLPQATCSASAAGEVRNSMLVTTGWLGEHLNDPSVVLLHIGKRDEFDAAHIPGAQLIETRMISLPRQEGSLVLELPPAEQLKATFEGFGISDSSHVILYFGNDWISPTTRVFFTLDVLGLGDRTALLDGGMPKWIAEKRPVTAEVKPRERGRITAKPNLDLVAGAAWVKDQLNKPTVAVIDARAPEFYDGSESGDMPRSGHIPGAMNLTFTKLVSETDATLLPPDALRKLFRDAGADPNDQIVAYCHIGQQATVVYFAARYLGYKVKLYDGSFQDWSHRTDLPVTAAKMTSCEQP